MRPDPIRDERSLQAALAELSKHDPAMAKLIAGLDSIPLRRRTPGFAGLAEIVIAQQVSKASASAMLGRLKQLVVPLDAPHILELGLEPLVAAGLSRAKQSTLMGLARAMDDGTLVPHSLCEMPANEAMDHLTALKGIGPWTAEVFLLFSAGHVDVFPAGDVALQHAVGWVCEFDGKPDQKQTRQLAERWAPLRGVAARVLYAHYGKVRGMEELPV